MKPQVYHVDAFTSQPFRGNSAGVVFPADNLSEAQMQLIARELGHSETAFLLHSDDSDVRIRYFTPTVEVPICGHATVAAHYVRAKVLGLGNCTIWQTSLAGKHRVTIEKHNDDYRISDAPRDKCVHFREINGIAAAFQYLQKNYNPTAASSL